MDYLELLRGQFNNRVDFREKRPGIMQLIAPLYHEDGDMLEIFLETKNGQVRVSDFGMTLMRLSYSYELNTPNKEKVFRTILDEAQVEEAEGKLFVDVSPENLYSAILQFSQTIAKVSNMSLYRREVVQSLFYEMLGEFIEDALKRYSPHPKVTPVPERDDLEVDYQFDVAPHPVYLFGVKDASKARLVTISCLEFQLRKLPFKSIVVHEDFANLSRKDVNRITSAADKQFVSLDNFKESGPAYFEREIA